MSCYLCGMDMKNDIQINASSTVEKPGVHIIQRVLDHPPVPAEMAEVGQRLDELVSEYKGDVIGALLSVLRLKQE